MKNVFNKTDTDEIINRINKLSNSTKANWGKMTVAQMLAHCNITYEMVYENKHPKPTGFTKFILKLFVKKIVVNEAPYKHYSRSAPQFLITETKDFETEKKRLIDYINKTQQAGESFFDGKESLHLVC